jgi:hypothetical protein
MKERILSYRKRIDELLNGENEVDWNSVMEEHLIQIGFFQHERFVHLIVTITFALLEMLAVSVFLITEELNTIWLSVAFMVLLIPYISHYYLLENETQKMYIQYDKMLEMIRKQK